jgi:hypothetical protein
MHRSNPRAVTKGKGRKRQHQWLQQKEKKHYLRKKETVSNPRERKETNKKKLIVFMLYSIVVVSNLFDNIKKIKEREMLRTVRYVYLPIHVYVSMYLVSLVNMPLCLVNKPRFVSDMYISS